MLLEFCKNPGKSALKKCSLNRDFQVLWRNSQSRKRCIIRSELELTQSMPIEHLLKKFNTKNEREEGKSLVYTQSRVGLQRILKIRIPTMQDADIFEKTKSTQLHNP